MSSPSSWSDDFENEEKNKEDNEDEVGWRTFDDKDQENFTRDDEESYYSSDEYDQERKSDDSYTEGDDSSGDKNSYIEEDHTHTSSRHKIGVDDYSIKQDGYDTKDNEENSSRIDDVSNRTDNNSDRAEYDDGNISYPDRSPHEEKSFCEEDDSLNSDGRSFYSGEESESYFSGEESESYYSGEESESESYYSGEESKSYYSDGRLGASDKGSHFSQENSYSNSEVQSLPGGYDREKSSHQAECKFESDEQVSTNNENESHQSEIDDSSKDDDHFFQLSNTLLPDSNITIVMHSTQHEDIQSNQVSDDETSIKSQNESHRSDSKRSFVSTSVGFQGESQKSLESIRSEIIKKDGKEASFSKDLFDNEDDDAIKSLTQNDDINQQPYSPTSFEKGDFQKEIDMPIPGENSREMLAFSANFENDFFAKNETPQGPIGEKSYNESTDDFGTAKYFDGDFGSNDHFSIIGEALQENNEDIETVSRLVEETDNSRESIKVVDPSTVVEVEEGSHHSNSLAHEENESRASRNDSSQHGDFTVVGDNYDKTSYEETKREEDDRTEKSFVSTRQNSRNENDLSSCYNEEEINTNHDTWKPRSGNVSFTVNEPIIGKKTLIILCTMFPTTETETHDQNQVTKICELNKILPFIIMGEHEPLQKDELFAISKECTFPQIFLYWNHCVQFLGDFIDVYEMDEKDEFNQGMLECSLRKVLSNSSYGEDVSNNEYIFSDTQRSKQVNINKEEEKANLELSFDCTNDSITSVNNIEGTCSLGADRVEDLTWTNDNSNSNSNTISSEHFMFEIEEPSQVDDQFVKSLLVNNGRNETITSSNMDQDSSESPFASSRSDSRSFKDEGNESSSIDNRIADDRHLNNDGNECWDSSARSNKVFRTAQDDDDVESRLLGQDEIDLVSNEMPIKHEVNDLRPIDSQHFNDLYLGTSEGDSYKSSNGSVESSKSLKDENCPKYSSDCIDDSLSFKNEADDLGSLNNQILSGSYESSHHGIGSSRPLEDEVDKLESLRQKEINLLSNDKDHGFSESFYDDSVSYGSSKEGRPPCDRSVRSLSHQGSNMSSIYSKECDEDINRSGKVDNDVGRDSLPVVSGERKDTTSELHDESICDSKDDKSDYSDSRSSHTEVTAKDNIIAHLEDRELDMLSGDSLRQKQASGIDQDSSSVSKPSNASYSIGKIGDDFEVSMMIGEVFGQANELFEDYKKVVQSSDKNSGDATPTEQISDGHVESSIYTSELEQDTELQKDARSSRTDIQAPSEYSELRMQSKDYTTKKSNDTTVENEINNELKGSTEKYRSRKKKKRKKKRKKEAKSPALLEFATNVNETILDLEDQSESNEQNIDSSANRLLHGFDALLGIFLQLSDELELIATFSKFKKKRNEKAVVHINALKAILSFADTFDQLFVDLKPVLLDCFEEEPDKYMDVIIYRLNSLVDLVCETTHRVGERQEYNERAETTYVTLLELIERDSLDLRCYFDDIDTPDQGTSANVHEAWVATGHIEELRALQNIDDPKLFRQICYEVMLSTDKWCPDVSVLMEICNIDPELLDEEPDQEYLEEDELAPIPQAAEHILDKVNGETLRRSDVFASILRRILPPRAVTDATLLDKFTSIRNTIQSPLGLSATNIVSISSVPETNDPDALGLSGVGKSTLAAMIAEHTDVRRYFIDGVVWIYVGDEELNYSRYTQCLRELVAQLDFYDGVPLFAELLHTPGETLSKRRRREEGFMIYARDTIAGLLQDRSVLIILDDVCFEPDMDWFDFAPMPDESIDGQQNNCALVITTRCRSLLPAADTVEIDMLEEADAISLLIHESGQLSYTLMAESKEARSVVRECANHPLAVKSVGRWLNLKHATAGVVSSVEEIHTEVIQSMDKILKVGDNTGTDMMYEILGMSLSPAINGGPTNIIKFCFAAFIIVFCDRNHISDFALTEPTPIIPMDMADLLFETLLEMYEVSLLKKALGVLKVITYSDAEDEEEDPEDEQKFLQVMHSIHHEYGEYLANDELSLKDFTKDSERQWNGALVDAYLSRVIEWDTEIEEAAHSYALEMIISHMIRGDMLSAAADLLTEKSFIRGRLISLGRENSTKRHIKDCETLFAKLKERRPQGSKLDPRLVMKHAYQALGRQLAIDDGEQIIEDSQIKNVEIARARYEIGFSLAENRCWDAAIVHWEISQELLVSALGTVEVVAGILYNIGVVYSEINEYEKALNALKKCLKIRGPIHGEEHILYAQTIQKIGDIFLNMSDYNEALESYQWALDVMYKEPDHHHIEIGEILDNKGSIHYSKGEIEEALQCHQEALRSKQDDFGEDHPELAATYHHIGNCLSDQGNIDDAIIHFEEAIRLKELDPEGGPERDADVLTIEGILNNLEGDQEQGLECYEKSLQILVTKVPYRKEKVASLLHLIGCVYLMSGEQKKAMKLFEESLQARRKILGFVHLDVASTLFNMAFLHQTRNRLDKALCCLEEALKIRQLRLPDSEKVAVTHEKIGSLARAIGKAKKAQIAFEEALKIRKIIHGEQHEAVATVLQELGDLMDDLGEYESAMSFYIDALDIRRSRLGLDDIAVSETLYSMGYTLHNNDEPERALVCFVESLSIRRYQLGEDSKEVGDTLNMMGFLKAKRGELDDALTLLWDALRIRKLQDDLIKVSETLKNIGNVHREKEELELAIECYEECLRIRRIELGTDHEKIADALIAMGNILSDMQRNEEAMQSYQEALKIRTQVFSEHDESVATVLQYMGTMEFRANNYDKARDLLTEFIRIRRENSTKNDGDYVNVLFMIGNIHKMEGQEAEAKLCWNESFQVFQELGLTDQNPEIAEVMNSLLKVENLEEQETEAQNKKSLFGIMTKLYKDKSDDGLHQKGRKRRKGKGFKL